MFNATTRFILISATACLVANSAFAGAMPHGKIQPGTVVIRTDGKVLGTDPAARIRFELLRDAYASEN